MSEDGPGDDLEKLVVAEIVTLHETFEAWFAGKLATMRRIEGALASDLIFISPRGDAVDRDELLEGLASGKGRRDIRIRVVDPKPVWRGGDTVLASYEEWHDHTNYTTRRRSSALLTAAPDAPGGVVWRYVHETWITPPPSWVVPPRRA